MRNGPECEAVRITSCYSVGSTRALMETTDASRLSTPLLENHQLQYLRACLDLNHEQLRL